MKPAGSFPILILNLVVIVVLIYLPDSGHAIIKDHYELAIRFDGVLAELYVHIACYSCAGNVSNPVHPVEEIKDYYFYTLLIGVILVFRSFVLRERHNKVPKEE